MCDYGEDDETDVWVFEWIKARKTHACCACDEPIAAGQIYHSYKALRDGEWSRWVHCGRCWRVCEAIWQMNDGAAIDLNLACGEVWESPPDDVAALAFALPGEMREADEYGKKDTRRHVMP